MRRYSPSSAAAGSAVTESTRCQTSQMLWSSRPSSSQMALVGRVYSSWSKPPVVAWYRMWRFSSPRSTALPATCLHSVTLAAAPVRTMAWTGGLP